MPFNPAIESIAALCTPLPILWGFCGGWALDLFLNRITRVHKDVDVAILRTDQHLVFDFLLQRDWTLEQAVDGKLLPFQEDEFLSLPIHTIWCRNKAYYPDFLEVFLSSASGFPVLAPEVVLLYKSNHPLDTEDWLDFQSAIPLLEGSSFE